MPFIEIDCMEIRTRNFTLDEVIHRTEDFPDSLLRIARTAMGYLQALRDYLGVPLIITSGYRDPQYNTSIGGSRNSHHIWRYTEQGEAIWAVDLYSPSMPLDILYEDIQKFVVGEVYMHTERGFVHLCPFGQDEAWVV